MWLSQKRKNDKQEPVLGMVSISGEKTSVLGYTEHRNTAVFAPGGYFWKPQKGETVLVLKNDGTDIIGRACEEADIAPGEVCIRSSGGAEIRLCNDGNIYIKGKIITEGEV